MGKAHINIGSNLGNSRSAIERAVAGIALLAQGGTVRRSRLIESEPWGFESPRRFLNLGVEIETCHAPGELLERLLSLQNSICNASHRSEDGGYADRMIDIDLIYYDSEVIPESWPEAGGGAIVVPHPRMHMREFVLGPVAQLDPCWRHPVTGRTAAEMLSRLNDRDGS